MNTPAPRMFVSHGAPTLALEKNGPASNLLREAGAAFDEVKALVVLSPHWMTRGGVGITGSERLETLHDFGGFPAEMYRLQYPAVGSPHVAKRVAEKLSAAGIVHTGAASI